MIADLKPYAHYKESEVPWIGQVPTHWGTRVLKRLCSRSAIYGANIPASNYVSSGLRFLRTTDITDDGTLRRGGVFVSQAAAQDYMLADGDILVSRSGTIGRSLHYRTAVHGQCAYAGYLVRFVPAPNVSADYLFHFTKSLAFADFIRVSAVSSTIENVNGDKFANMPVTLPPSDEQASIVRFLDWANGRLERAIRAMRKVIALLNEQRQAIIHRAVTRGLDPSVPLKPSGIPWLGDIPQHWEVMPLKSVCVIQSGITLGKDYTGQALREYPYLRVANVQAGHVNLSVVKTIRVSKTEADRCTLQGGDVLMTEGGDLDKLGRGCVWNAQVSPCIHQNHVFAARPNQSRLNPRFLSALMGTGYARAYFQSTAKQTTNLAATNKTKLGMFKVLLPGVDEQYRILSTLDEELRPVSIATARFEREIDLLREYRARLVADVVTGKLDVREAAAQLPEETMPAEEDATDADAEATDVSAEAEFCAA